MWRRRTAATTWRNGGTRSGQQPGRRASGARLDTRSSCAADTLGVIRRTSLSMQHWQPPQHSRDGPPFGGFPCSAALGRNVRSSTKKIAMYGLIVVLTTLALYSIVFAGELTGPAKVISTDTLEIHGTRIRLWGIDAPDKSQMCRDINLNPYRCGLMAASDLEAFIAEREVSCLSVLEDECGRTLAICSADGIDLGEWLVRNGLVLDWERYSRRRYHAAQRAADRAGLGLWAGSFAVPWLYRACIRLGGGPASCSDDANAHP